MAITPSLVYDAQEIPLPVEVDATIESFGMTTGQNIFVVYNGRTAIKPFEEPWDFSPSGFSVSFMAPTALLVGDDFSSGQAALWEPTRGTQGFTVIPGSGFQYAPTGLDNVGHILLRPSNAGAEQSVIYRDGNISTLSELGYPFEIEGLLPLSLLPSGTLRGVYVANADSRQPFAISNKSLTIDDALSLDLLQASRITEFSENGHAITSSDDQSVELFGPRINGIQKVELFRARSINNHGYAVGESIATPPYATTAAMLWSPELGLRDLNDLAPAIPYTLTRASSIQDDLSLLALTRDSENKERLYLLTVADSKPVFSMQLRIEVQTDSHQISIEPNFVPDNLILQRRNRSGAWVDIDLAPTAAGRNTFRFELTPASTQLLRVFASVYEAN